MTDETAILRTLQETRVCPVAANGTRRIDRISRRRTSETTSGVDNAHSRTATPAISLAYRTGFYVGALYGYQLVSEVSPVDGPDFCQGFADGIEIVTSWLRRYLAEGGTFDSALGDLMPYFPVLRTWVGDASTVTTARPAKPPSRRERIRRQWEQDVCSIMSREDWLTAKEIAQRLNGRGPHSLRTLSQLLNDLTRTGLVERSEVVEVAGPRHRSVRWRLPPTKRAAKQEA